MPGERTASGPKQTRSVRAIRATRTWRDRTTSRACRCRISSVWRARRADTARKAKPIRSGIYAPSAAPSWSQSATWGEIVGYRVIESRGGTSHRGPSVAGQLIADRVGEIIARRELERARVRLEMESCDAHPVSPQVQAVSPRAPGTGDEAVRRRRRTPTTAARPRVLGAFDDGRHRRERARRKFALRPGPSFGWRIREMGLTPSHEDDDTLRAWRRGNVTVDWSASYAAAWARLSRAG
jgi:hypothetical protein